MQSMLMSDALALRIGLAAKALGGVSIKSLLALLTEQLGAPLDEAQLSALSPKKWRTMAAGLSGELGGELSRAALDQAHAVLCSQTLGSFSEPAPAVSEPLPTPGILVAMTSNREQQLDGHFGSCLRILIYQVTPDAHRLVEVREVNSELKGEERSVYLVSLLRGCDLLFTVSIGGPAAAKVTRAGVHPVKVKAPCSCAEQLAQLSAAIASHPPRWLANKLLAAAKTVGAAHTAGLTITSQSTLA